MQPPLPPTSPSLPRILPQPSSSTLNLIFPQQQLGAPANFWDPLLDPAATALAKSVADKAVYGDPLGLLAEAASAVRDCAKDGDAGQDSEPEKDVGIASCAYFDEVQSPTTSFTNFLESAPIMKLITLEE